MGSLTGARDREFAVCRIKSKMLKNCRDAREPPQIFVCDEQLCPYFGHTSGLKKGLPKKKIEGIEYFSLAVCNKDYEGYKADERAKPADGELKGKLIRPADPVCGGYKLHYIMSPGARYDPGSPNPSKTLGPMILLIFMCGGYLRFRETCAVTDSAYGFLEAMMYLSLWSINWVSSLRLSSRKGFLGVKEFKEAGTAEEQKRKKRRKVEPENFKSERSRKKDLSA